MLSEQNLSYKTPEQNLEEFPEVLANLLRDGARSLGTPRGHGHRSGRAGACGCRASGPRNARGPVERWRILGLAVIAGLLFLLLPFDIRGAIYYLNTRYAHLAAPLLLASVPPVAARLRPLLLVAGGLAAAVLALPLGAAFRAFDAEAAPLLRFAEETPPDPESWG